MGFPSGWPGDRERALAFFRGKSALHRAGCRVTPGAGNTRRTGHRNIPPASAGKGEMVGEAVTLRREIASQSLRVRDHRAARNGSGQATPIRSKAKQERAAARGV